MFYWKGKTENQKTLTEELLSCKSIQSMQIASAFVSWKGVEILRLMKEKYNLPKERIILYLSEQFSSDKPGDMLVELLDLCTVKILLENQFHSKVFFLNGEENKLIYGSSNFTNGGLSDNIEFDFVGIPSKEEKATVQSFFKYCDDRATVANADIVRFYKDQQPELDELNVTQKKIKIRLSSYIRKDDPFTPDTYGLSDFYFTFEDYETFFPRNAEKVDREISAKRLTVQKKMLDIHNIVYPSIKKLGVAHHKREENITSLIRPCQYNKNSVGWIGVRYGKLPHEVDALNFGKTDDDDAYGFQKHGCLQFSVNSDGFDINLFLAVRNGAIDRMKLSEHQYRMLSERRPQIESEMKKLVGHHFEWRIENGTPAFRLDDEPIGGFCDWFKTHDEDGYESYLMKYYEPDDPILKTKESIAAEVVRVMTMLRPLYDAMVWRPLKQ